MSAKCTFLILFFLTINAIKCEEQNGEEFVCNKGLKIGCISNSSINFGKTFLVEFQTESEADTPELCANTCANAYENSIYALVSWQKDSGMDCHCASAGAITKGDVGPELFCNLNCPVKGETCGGSHVFHNGSQIQYFSIYCIYNQTSEKLINRMMINEEDSSAKLEEPVANVKEEEEKEEEEILKALKTIWMTLMKTNIVSLVIMGLLFLLVILLLVLLVLVYFFIENYDPKTGGSLFYRRLSGITRKPNNGDEMAAENTNTTKAPSPRDYGAVNKAFEPHNDTDSIPGIFVDSGSDDVVGPSVDSEGRARFYYGMDRLDHEDGDKQQRSNSQDEKRDNSKSEEENLSQASADTEMADEIQNGTR